MNDIFFIALISRDIDPPVGEEQLLSERVDEQTGHEPAESGRQEVSLVNNTLRCHFLANMALDVFLSPLYGGECGVPSLMFVQDGINVYGYETNTGLKILIGTDGELDQSYETIFKQIHRIYLGLLLNPFNTGDSSSSTPTFNHGTISTKIEGIVNQWKAQKA
ncbi:hypothetical protein BN1211_5664 [Cyberlindnera jadinii]|uniref:Sedlin n=1 Tax=Cyberlindnera jadinii (strain ATCC 18201 / CBS 1600 / BCRC 20928 / JCM 3617 / NBRC 0987 / NRRL Y-1542) TaxID=983966 RepID=A0A0H5C9M4_CYBJN|nr:hypothetical protein BN1211_5664 [Cyberlindnera jadinii]